MHGLAGRSDIRPGRSLTHRNQGGRSSSSRELLIARASKEPEEYFTLVDEDDGLNLAEAPLQRQSMDGLPVEDIYLDPTKKKEKEPAKKTARERGSLRRSLRESFKAEVSQLPKAKGASSEKPGRKRTRKGWLAGKRDSKRRKLEENSALHKWLSENEVWMYDAPRMGMPSHPMAMAVETREEVENEISGRGLIARRGIYKNERLVEVPERITFSAERAVEKFGEDVLRRFADEDQYTAIVLHLLYEKYIEKESFWKPYIDVLPNTEEIGASWTWPREEIETLLNGSHAKDMALTLNDTVVAAFEDLQEDLFKEHPDLFPPDVFTLERFIWGYSILLSRAVKLIWPGEDPQGAWHLVPYIDLVNHSPNVQVAVISNEIEGKLEPFKPKGKMVYIRAEEDYKEYQQIYISYGEKTNAQLLLSYGFSLARNIHDYVPLTLEHHLDSVNCSFPEEKRQLIRERGWRLEAFPLFRDKMTLDMRRFLRLLVTTHEEMKIRSNSSTFEAIEALRKMNFDEPLDELSERRAVELLIEELEEKLEEFPSSIEEDNVAINDQANFELLPKNTRNAMRVRYLEKQIVSASLAAVKKVEGTLGRITEREMDAKQKRAEMQKAGMWQRVGIAFKPRKYENLNELLTELGV